MSEWKLGDANKTTGYILPYLSQNGKLTIDNFYNKLNYPERNFVNSFVKCEDYPDLDYCLFLLYKKDLDNPVYRNFETRLQHLPEYSFEYEPDDVHKMYVFNVKEFFYKSYDKFLEGKYSKINNGHKDLIMKFHKLNPEEHIKNPEKYKNKLVAVLHKQIWLKELIENELLNSEFTPKEHRVKLGPDDEYSSKPYIEEETFLNKYKLYVQ